MNKTKPVGSSTLARVPPPIFRMRWALSAPLILFLPHKLAHRPPGSDPDSLHEGSVYRSNELRLEQSRPNPKSGGVGEQGLADENIRKHITLI